MATRHRSASAAQSTVPVRGVVRTRRTVNRPVATPAASAVAYTTDPMSQPSMPPLVSGLSPPASWRTARCRPPRPATNPGLEAVTVSRSSRPTARLDGDGEADGVLAVVRAEEGQRAGLGGGQLVAVLIELEPRAVVAAVLVAQADRQADEQHRDGGDGHEATAIVGSVHRGERREGDLRVHLGRDVGVEPAAGGTGGVVNGSERGIVGFVHRCSWLRRRSASARRAPWRWALAVPSAQPRVSAISAMLRSLT